MSCAAVLSIKTPPILSRIHVTREKTPRASLKAEKAAIKRTGVEKTGVERTGDVSRAREGRSDRVDDSRLIDKLIEGSDEGFALLYDTYGARIFNVVYRIVGDASESEDVVQEVFLKVLRNIANFNRQSSLYTWLYRIAANAAVDARKRFGPQRMMSIFKTDGEAFDLPSQADAPEAAPQRKEMADILRDAMDQLSDDHRTILVLREFDNLSYNEIADVLDCSKGTVESRLFRARNRLREKMEKYL